MSAEPSAGTFPVGKRSMSEGTLLEVDVDTSEAVKMGLRGRWLVAMKVQIVVGYIALVTAVPWAAWVTRDALANETFRSNADQFTQLDARDLEDRQRIARDILSGRIEARLSKLEQDSARSLAILERIETSIRRPNQ